MARNYNDIHRRYLSQRVRMAIEIEKKFLLADERWRAEVTESAPMRQAT
ncbi:hypothetical protein [Methylogaea oryzae]|nr:hypothetical protein [Methylogaea oryzae]